MNIKYNGELKVIDTQEKAYLLGQIYGDGCNNCTNKYKFTMSSINTDIAVYTELANLFPFLKLKTYKSHTNMIYLEYYKKDLCLDLMALGMVSNKTKKDVTGEFHFPDLRKDLLPHFIRGYFDADGSVWFPTRSRSRNNKRIEFGVATKNFLLKLKEVLDENNIKFTWHERYKKAGNGKLYYSYSIISSNKETSLKFADYIYKDATIYLAHKYNKCYKDPEYRPTTFSLYGICPNCGSQHIIKSGTRNHKQRLKCCECKINFTRPLPK